MRAESFDWTLDVDYRGKRFSGRVAMSLRDAPSELALDAAGLTIHSVTGNGKSLPYRTRSDAGTLELESVPSDEARIEIAYDGAASEKAMVGFYVSPLDGTGHLLTTMCFPTGAGRLLPCFEHPATKTVFRLTLRTDPGLATIFNSPIVAEESADGRRTLRFAPTPRMSAYLLFLAIGPVGRFQHRSHDLDVAVAMPPGQEPAGAYAAERAAELVRGYSEYYRLPYPLPKLDLIAVRHFWAGAMENWGAISGQEGMLLVDAHTSTHARRAILQLLSHEIAHQWFGNLVTARWWDDFWLNESFATFVGAKILERLYPDFHPWNEFLPRWTRQGFDEDALASAHPVHLPIARAEDVGEIADLIVYGKGASVLRMIEAYLGEDGFRRGITEYLTKFQYGNAEARDLWEALERATEKPVRRIMPEWILRPGHPVVEVRQEGARLRLRQRRFAANGEHAAGVWPIPLTYRTEAGVERTLYERAEMDLPLPPGADVWLNPGRTGFYRVRYAGALFDRALDRLRSLPGIDQWAFLEDAFAFFLSGDLSRADFLRCFEGASGLREYLPLHSAAEIAETLLVLLGDDPEVHAAALGYLRTALGSLDRTPSPGETEAFAVLRGRLEAKLAHFDPAHARTLAPRFAEWESVAPDLRQAVGIAYARVGGAEAFERIVARLRATSRDMERLEMLWSLAAVPTPDLAARALALLREPSFPAAHARLFLPRLSGNRAAAATFWAWLREGIDDLARGWKGTPLLSETLREVLPFLGLGRAEEVRAFFRDHPLPGAERGIEAGLAQLDVLDRFVARALTGASDDAPAGDARARADA